MTGAADHSPDDWTPLAELAEAFAALVELLHDGESTSMSPEQILRHAAAAMPSSKHADLTTLEHGEPRSIATSGDLPDRLREIRRRTGEGPSLDVLDTNDLVLCSDLGHDPRWPEFAELVVAQTDIRSIASYRLFLGPDHKAALSFYSDWPHAFDDLAIATGAIFAAYCSLALLTELILRDSLTHRRAADVHREIGVAIGILMTHGDLTSEAAYQRLHEASRRLRRSLPDIAHTVTTTREMPDEDATTSP